MMMTQELFWCLLLGPWALCIILLVMDYAKGNQINNLYARLMLIEDELFARHVKDRKRHGRDL